MWEDRISEGWTPATHDLKRIITNFKKCFIRQRVYPKMKDYLLSNVCHCQEVDYKSMRKLTCPEVHWLAQRWMIRWRVSLLGSGLQECKKADLSKSPIARSEMNDRWVSLLGSSFQECKKADLSRSPLARSELNDSLVSATARKWITILSESWPVQKSTSLLRDEGFSTRE